LQDALGNPLQKFSRAKLALLVGVTAQASARSPAVLMFKLMDGAVGDWVAWCIGEAQARLKPKMTMNRIEHLMTGAPRSTPLWACLSSVATMRRAAVFAPVS
jgi:hypothetical protein